jgi:predicted CXXCH cytochrome family protein
MRKTVFLIALVAALAVAFAVPALALANFGPHGGYATDTDACAGCHRAHTSFSAITWTDQFDNTHSALLVASGTKMYQFCNACHGDGAPGASTNVVSGTFNGADPTVDPDGGPSTAASIATSAIQPYKTASIPMGTLNGGGFESVNGVAMTSNHIYTDEGWGAYGGGTTGDVIGQNPGQGPNIMMGCTSCHDPHGSSNYRLLKDNVNNLGVGGYDTLTGEIPAPFVLSNETGYPQGGWLKHVPGALQMATYVPDYTRPKYAMAPGQDKNKGISVWCAACHTQYTVTSSVYNAGDGASYVLRHRHPVNTELSKFTGPTSLLVTTMPLPLAHSSTDTAGNTTEDWIDCLTCHVAHGTSVTMTGWAGNAAELGNPNFPNMEEGNRASMLLRRPNRGVCEVCHNK